MNEIADRAICKRCQKPNIIWLPWKNYYLCGWCGHHYTVEQANDLKMLSDIDFIKIVKQRLNIIGALDREDKMKIRMEGSD